jgi:hypothetical protein
MQMLVLVILATGVGIWGLIKARGKRFGGRKEGYTGYAGARQSRGRWQDRAFKELKEKGLGIGLKMTRAKAVVKEPVFDFGGGGRERKGKDLSGGMEMLQRDFLLRVVEKTGGKDKNDVMMRKFSFKELVRREELKAADSKAIKIYAINKDNIYGKDIQCVAMKELAERTELVSV